MQYRQKKRLQMLFGIFLLCIAITLIGISAFFYEMSFFVTPSTLLLQYQSSFLRLGGKVKDFAKTDKGYTFMVEDEDAHVLVYYKGCLPPLFKVGQGVVVEGTFDRGTKTFYATKVFAKHDEKYMPKSLVRELKENGRWKKSYSS